MTPKYFSITKHKVLSENDGMTATEFGNYQLSDLIIELEFSELELSDLEPEEIKEVKVGTTLFLNFDNYSLYVAPRKRRHEDEDDREIILNSKEPIEATVLEVDSSRASEGILRVKVEAGGEF